MKELSVAQEFLLLSLNEKGALPSFHIESQGCIVAAGLMELFIAGCVSMEGKKVAVTGALPEDRSYLTSLYEFIKDKPRTLTKIAEEYNFTFLDRRLNALIGDLGEALVAAGGAGAEKGGLLDSKERYVPDPQAVDRVAQKIRAEVLEEGPLSDEMVVLVSLLDKCGGLKRYFSQFEREAMLRRVREVRQSDSAKVAKEMVDYIITLLCVIAAT